MDTPSKQPVVMIVAGHPILRNAISESLMLMLPDCDCVEIRSVEEAVERLAERRADVALLDENLISEHGGPTVDRLREVAPGLRIVLMVDEDTADRGLIGKVRIDSIARKRHLYVDLGSMLPELLAPRTAP